MVLDTHVWLWWVSNPERLSETSREAMEQAVNRGQPLYVSTISTREVALLVKKERLRLSLPVAEWVRRSQALSILEFVPVTNSIALASVDLEMHSDPADRIIVSTALQLGQTLVTKDDKLQALSIPTLW